jgi:Phage integrase, N-terminal SAM-like domain
MEAPKKWRSADARTAATRRCTAIPSAASALNAFELKPKRGSTCRRSRPTSILATGSIRSGRKSASPIAGEWVASTVHLKPSTQVSYELLLRLHILPWFGKAALGRIQRKHIQQWISDLIAQGVGPGTVRNAYRVLARILQEAENDRMIARNPARRVPLPK